MLANLAKCSLKRNPLVTRINGFEAVRGYKSDEGVFGYHPKGFTILEAKFFESPLDSSRSYGSVC